MNSRSKRLYINNETMDNLIESASKAEREFTKNGDFATALQWQLTVDWLLNIKDIYGEE